MKQLFGILVLGLVMGVAGCATNVEKGDELAQQGKYREAIELYKQVDLKRDGKEEYGKAFEGIANCNFQLGEIEFNGKNWKEAIALYEKANTPEAKERVSSCNFQLGEIEFNGKQWEKAIALYEKANTPEGKERISTCNFQLGEIEYNGKHWEKAIALYSKSSQVESAERIKSAKLELEKIYVSDAKKSMAKGLLRQAHSSWSKLDKDSKAYADNKKNIEKTLVSYAGTRLEANDFSKAISLLESKKFSTKKYANQAASLLKKAKRQKELAQLQKTFESERARFNSQYKSYENQIKKSGIFTEAAQWTSGFVSEYPVFKNFKGKITRIQTDTGGSEVSVVVESDLSSITVEYHGTVRKFHKDVYNNLGNLSVGESVTFTWEPIPSTDRGISELSWSESGTMYNPEFMGMFKDIY